MPKSRITEITSFIKKSASSSPAMKGTTDINATVKMSSTVYRFRISMVRKRRVGVGVSTDCVLLGREHGDPRRDEETRVRDVQAVGCRVDCERMCAVVKGDRIELS